MNTQFFKSLFHINIKKTDLEKNIFTIKKIKVFQLFTICLRYVLGAAFVYSSIYKILGIRFTPNSGENAPIDTLPHFFESMYRSGFYWQFIGWGQLIAGFLLMSHIFSTLGAIMFFPIMLNVFIITISFQSPVILGITSLMLLANLYLLLWDWNRLKFIVLSRPGSYVEQDTQFSNRKVWSYLGLFFFIVAIFIRLVNTKIDIF